LILDIRFKLNK